MVNLKYAYFCVKMLPPLNSLLNNLLTCLKHLKKLVQNIQKTFNQAPQYKETDLAIILGSSVHYLLFFTHYIMFFELSSLKKLKQLETYFCMRGLLSFLTPISTYYSTYVSETLKVVIQLKRLVENIQRTFV